MLNDTNLVSGFNYEKIDEKIYKALEKSIENSLCLEFIYKNKNRTVKPYKLLNLKGIWYLIAVENKDIKNFSITKIRDLKLGYKFKKEQNFINIINNSNTFISKNLITIKLKASKEVSEFLKRRDVFPNQKILNILENGDILLETKASFEPEILGIISYWLPHISIVEPLYLKKKLLKNLEIYLNKEKKCF